MPLELPAVTRAARAERRLERGELLGASCPGRGCSSRSTLADRDELVGEAAGGLRRRPALLRASAKASWSSRETPQRSATFSPVSPMLSSGNIASSARVGEAPAERRVVDRAVRRARTPARASASTSGARVIDSTPPATKRSPSPAMTAWQADDDRREARRAEPVHGHARHRLRAARRAAPPCGRRCGCPRRPGSRSRGRRPRSRPGRRRRARRPRAIATAARSSGRTPRERAAVAADRRPHRRDDHRPAHAARPPPRARAARSRTRRWPPARRSRSRSAAAPP